MRKPPEIARYCIRSNRLGLKASSRSPTSSATWVREHIRHLANVRDERGLPDTWFSSSRYRVNSDPLNPGPQGRNEEDPPPNERTVKLGKTIRILHDRLPTLLTSPLPPEILSPQIKLNLFPSTHPHLPSVSGKIAYSAALWTAPVAWGRVPVVGNVKLIIISERMIKNGVQGIGGQQLGGEKLIVRWRTCGKTKQRGGSKPTGAFGQVDKITEFLGGVETLREGEDQEFSGLFIFSFDEEGRILSHTIEHAQQGGNWEKMTSRVVNVTDWLLGRARWKKVGEEQEEGLALGYGCCEVEEEPDVRRNWQRHRDPGEKRSDE